MASDTLEAMQVDESASSKSPPKEGTEAPEIGQGNEAVLYESTMQSEGVTTSNLRKMAMYLSRNKFYRSSG